MASRDEPKLKYLPWYWRDFIADGHVQRMTDAQCWWYLKLLANQFEIGWIPDDPVTWAAVVRPVDSRPGDPEYDAFFGQMVPSLFPKNPDGKRRNPRMEIERVKQIAIVQGRIKGGNMQRHNLKNQ